MLRNTDMPQTEILARKVARRKPFRIEKVPWVTRIYRYPFERWTAHGHQALFGVFHISFFLFYQRFIPVKPKGTFLYTVDGKEKRIVFDGRNTQFEALYRSHYVDGYEPEVTTLVDSLLPSDGVFYDIGSNWGYHSLWAASNPGFHGQIHAFEPFPSTFVDLKSVVEQAGLTDRVALHKQAVSDHAGTTAMHLPNPLHSGWATMDDDSGAQQQGKIPVVTLDSLQIAPPAIMKIDAEKAEAKVLRGARNLIAKSHPMIVFESLRDQAAPESTLEPFGILAEAGYTFFRLAWLREDAKGVAYLRGDDNHAPALKEDCLALVPFNPAVRFLAPEWMEVFACRRDDLPRLRSLFLPRTLGS